jgi:hypothetical protein
VRVEQPRFRRRTIGLVANLLDADEITVVDLLEL